MRSYSFKVIPGKNYTGHIPLRVPSGATGWKFYTESGVYFPGIIVTPEINGLIIDIPGYITVEGGYFITYKIAGVETRAVEGFIYPFNGWKPSYIFVPPPVHTKTAYDEIVLADNPMAYWAPDDTHSDDLTGNGHSAITHGTMVSTTMPNSITDKAVVFDGTNKYLEIPDSDAFSVSTTGVITIEAWIRPDVQQFDHTEGSGYVWWMGKGQPNQYEWSCRMYSLTNSENRPNRISGYAFNASGGLGTGSYFQDTVTPGQWIHYVFVINTLNTGGAYPHGYTKIYKNGVQRDQDDLFSTAPIIPTNQTAPLRIGTRDFNSWFQGAIGKIAIYNYELAQTQILEHTRFFLPPPGSGTGAFVKTVGTAIAETSGATLTFPIGSGGGVPNGNTVIIRCAHDYTAAAPTVTDTKGNIYTRDRTAATAGSTMRASIYSSNITTQLNPGDTITVTLPVAVNAKVAIASEYSGVIVPPAIDAQNGQAGTSTAPQAGGSGITTTYGNDVLVALLATKGPDSDNFTEDSTIGLYNQTAHIGTNNGGADNTNVTLNCAYFSTSSTGVYNYKPTLGVARDWIDFLVAYKAA